MKNAGLYTVIVMAGLPDVLPLPDIVKRHSAKERVAQRH